MAEGGGIDGVCPAPPPRAYPACSLRLHAPLSLERKGQGGWSLPSLLMFPLTHPVRPGHPPAFPLRSSASPLRWSEGGRCGFLPLMFPLTLALSHGGERGWR